MLANGTAVTALLSPCVLLYTLAEFCMVLRNYPVDQVMCLCWGRDNILRVHVRGLETAPDTTKVHKTIIVMPCCAGKSRQPNSTKTFAICRLNYNDFQTGRTATESWSRSV